MADFAPDLGRVAIVHDYLSQFGGAERVALAFSDLFDAPIYTSFYEPNGTFDEFRDKEIHTSFLQKVVPPGRFRFFAPFFGRAIAGFDLSAYDTVIVSSSGFGHHVRHPNAFVYCHTPPRFIYEFENYLASPLMRRAASPAIPWFRRRDQKAARQHRHYAANSAKTAKLISEVYGKQVPVLHPPLRTDHLPKELVPLPDEPRALMVTRLQPYKRVDLAMEACARADVPLTVVGGGISERHLKATAIGDVTFLGRVHDENLAALFQSHSVVLTPGVEDFGFAPLEANYAGRPVLARRGGGALETVTDNVNGYLIEGDDPEEWALKLKEALKRQWDPHLLREATAGFQTQAFARELLQWIRNSA